MLESIVITSLAILVLVIGTVILGSMRIANAKRALKKNPDNIKALKRTIRHHIGKGEQDKALEKLEHLLRLQPEDVDCLLLLATLRYQRKEYELADPYFKQLFDEELLTEKNAKRLSRKSSDYAEALTKAYLFQGHRLHLDGCAEAAEVFKNTASKYGKKLVKELALY